MDAFAELEDIAERKKGGPVKKKTNYEELCIEDSICEKIKDGFKQKEEGSFTKGEFEYTYKDRIALER